MSQDAPGPTQVKLPGLRAGLVVAAAKRYRVPARNRRWFTPLAFAALLLAAGGALAATAIFRNRDVIDTGQTGGTGESAGPYAIRIAPSHTDPEHPICLQLRFQSSRPAYGCGVAPTARQPFGLVVADGMSEESAERVIYGLVSADVARVSSLGESSTVEAVTTTEDRPGLPGRYFSLIVPDEGKIELAGFNTSGAEIAHIGSHEEFRAPPLSRAQAIVQGDPAGFAPTVVLAGKYVYDGERIEPRKAGRENLICVETRSAVNCFDTLLEAQAFSAALNAGP
jgi:hypothetical protein